MFLIKTYVDKSKIHGLGCFAGQALKKGQLVWVEHPEMDIAIPVAKTRRHPKSVIEFLKVYAYQRHQGGKPHYVLCGDNARYMNHSAEPNILEMPDGSSIAGRNIRKGEEITCDYSTFDLESTAKLKR